MYEVEESTGITPKALRDRPSLAPHLRPLLEAFYEVSAGRSYADGMSGRTPQPITGGEIRHHFETFYVSALVERERLFRAIRRLDGVYLRESAKKQRVKPVAGPQI